MYFKYKFSFDKRRKLDNGLFPIKVNLHSFHNNKNSLFGLPDYYTSKGRIVFGLIGTRKIVLVRLQARPLSMEINKRLEIY